MTDCGLSRARMRNSQCTAINKMLVVQWTFHDVPGQFEIIPRNRRPARAVVMAPSARIVVIGYHGHLAFVASDASE